MMLTSFTLVASEFMPVNLLTPIAGELAIPTGQAGQAITAAFLGQILALPGMPGGGAGSVQRGTVLASALVAATLARSPYKKA